MTNDSDRWRSALTLADLGDLTAQWLEGTISCLRYNVEGGGPDPETEALIPTLAALNRAGFVTDHSQPAEETVLDDGSVWRQRATVSGYTDRAMFERVRDAVLAAADPELLLIVHTVDLCGTEDGAGIVITKDGDDEYTWTGHWMTREELIDGNADFEAEYGAGWHDAAIAALCAARQVHIIDRVWGRNDVLWPLLDGVVRQL